LFLSLQNFTTADRPRCMLRDEHYQNQRRRLRKFDYGSDEYEQTTWYWNMNHQQQQLQQQPNGNVLTNGSHKKSHKSRASYESSARSSSGSGFQSFFRWFKKDDRTRSTRDISYPRELTSSSDTLEYEQDRRPQQRRRELRTFDSNDELTPPASPRQSYRFSQSSSCDSVFSTASSFAFVAPVKYLRNRKTEKVRNSARTLAMDPLIELAFRSPIKPFQIIHTPTATDDA